MTWKDRIDTWLASPGFQFACRLALGLIFIYASFYKIRDPGLFADQMAAYRILPESVVPMAALILPWVEMLCGLFLILGLFASGAVWLLIGMLLFFIAIAGVNILRGIEIDCGCFGPGGTPEPPLILILRDLLFLVPAALIVLFGKKKVN